MRNPFKKKPENPFSKPLGTTVANKIKPVYPRAVTVTCGKCNKTKTKVITGPKWHFTCCRVRTYYTNKAAQ